MSRYEHRSGENYPNNRRIFSSLNSGNMNKNSSGTRPKAYPVKRITGTPHWEEIPPLLLAAAPWYSDAVPETWFRACYDADYLHLQYTALGSPPIVWIVDNLREEVLLSERVEVFLRSNENMNPYYGLEIDPLGRVFDYRSRYYRQMDPNWRWPDSIPLHTNQQAECYTVQLALKLDTLHQLDLLHNNDLQAGIFRGHCTVHTSKGASFQWISFV